MLVDESFPDLQIAPEDLAQAPPVDLDGEAIPEGLPERFERLLLCNPRLRTAWESSSYLSLSEQAFAVMGLAGAYGLTKAEAAAVHVALYTRHGRKEDGIRKAPYGLKAWAEGRARAEARERDAGNGPPPERDAGEPGPEVGQPEAGDGRPAEAAPPGKAESECQRWQILDAADHPDWKTEPLEWMVKPFIPKGTVGITGGLPKIRKSLITLDLLLHVVHRRPWLERFEVGWSPRILYLAREDPTGRLQYRLAESQKVYGFPPLPRDQLLLLVRERFQLTEQAHREWLHRTIRDRGIEFVVLDVLNRMTRGLDPMSPKDWGIIMDTLETVNRELGVTIDILDHARKPPQGTGKLGGSSPVEVKGPIEKYGAMDWMLILSETSRANRVEVYAETKDSDERPHFLLDVAPKDSGKPKLTWAGDVTRLAEDRKEVGRENREAVLNVFQPGERLQGGKVEERMRAFGSKLGRAAIRGHLKALSEETPPRLARDGKNRETTYRLLEPSSTHEAGLDGEVQDELFSKG